VRVVVLVWVAACAPPPAVSQELRPTLITDGEMYNSRIVALRTTLGRAAIDLEMRGIERVVQSEGCDRPSAAKGWCVRCELAGRIRNLDGATLDAVATAFARYPTSVLESADIEHVALCRHIEHDSPNTAGTADLEARRLMISLEPFGRVYDALGKFTAEDIVHHELFHLLESARMADIVADDTEWASHNPPSYAPSKTGFVDEYAATNPDEDRASIFQYMMARPDELCEVAQSDPIVRVKAEIIWHRVAAVAGDSFLRARASCIDWIDAAR
jgi:hypothetical protein